MLQVLSKREVDKMHDDMIQWVTEALEGDEGSHIYNVLANTKQLMESMSRRKLTWKEQHKLFMDGFNFAEQQQKNKLTMKQINKLNKKK